MSIKNIPDTSFEVITFSELNLQSSNDYFKIPKQNPKQAANRKIPHSKIKQIPPITNIFNYSTKSTRNINTNINDITYDIILIDSNDNDSLSFLSSSQWMSILNDSSFMNMLKENNSLYKKYKYSLKYGVPSQIRPEFWKVKCNIKCLKSNFKSNFYTSLCNSHEKHKNDKDYITKDLQRTFFCYCITGNINVKCEFCIERRKTGQVKINTDDYKLEKLLLSYAAYDKSIGYCQGMNFIALRILNIIQSEEDSFWLFFHIMNNKDMRGLFLNETPKLILHINELKFKIKTRLSKLYSHFESEGFLENDNILGVFSGFYTTLFTYNVNYQLSLRVWDLFMEFGENVISEVIINMLKLCLNEIMVMKFDDLYKFFRNDFVNVVSYKYGVDRCIPEVD